MDISLTIMVAPPEGSMYRVGDIIDCSLMTSSPCRHPRFALIHITGIPDRAPSAPLLKRIRRMFGASIEDNQQLLNPIVLRRRKWFFDPVNTPNAVKQAIRDNKEFTATWAQLKEYIRRKLITKNDDESLDTSLPIESGDL